MSSGYSQGEQEVASLNETLSVQEFVAEGEGNLRMGRGYSVLLVSLLSLQLYYVYIVAAAVCVSCQDLELTSTLRNGSHACRGEEVIFTCTIRSADVDTLILAWSSPEYVGQGNRLRFTIQQIPGTTRISMINGNVVANLTSNTNIDGVRTLVSELRIVADQASTVTCISESTTSEDSAMFNVSGT